MPKSQIILVSRNISEQFGGEAIKSLQILLELSQRGYAVHQIVHERVKAEIDKKFPDLRVSYIPETWLHKVLFRLPVLRNLLLPLDTFTLGRLAEKTAREEGAALIHYTSPVSPVIPYPSHEAAPVVIGPLNGNIHYPPAFNTGEGLSYRLRRLLRMPTQMFLRLFPGKARAAMLLVAGGERTKVSLREAGAKEERFRDSIDSGIPNALKHTARAPQRGKNLRFVHNGRLVDHKGTDLVIKALKQTKLPVTLDVIGRGPCQQALVALAAELGVSDRVKFIPWVPNHEALHDMLREYRAFVFPSLAEANGIVVQEAMMMGLPVVCLDWGGPALLVTKETGFAIPPNSPEQVVRDLAVTMDRLAEDGDLAERISVAARARAESEGYAWEDVIDHWLRDYDDALRAAGKAPLGPPANAPVGAHASAS